MTRKPGPAGGTGGKLYNILLLAKHEDKQEQLASALEKRQFEIYFPDERLGFDEAASKVNPQVVLIEPAAVPDSTKLCRYLKQERRLSIIALVTVEAAARLDGCFDDFVLMTASPREVAIRIERLLERSKKVAEPGQMTIGKLVIDTEKYEVYVGGRPVSLTFKEYELLRFLASNPGRVFTRDALLNRVWGEDYFGGDRTVDVHVRRLRGKIEDPETVYIETVRNIGYRFKKLV